jgi:hypothetical protein
MDTEIRANWTKTLMVHLNQQAPVNHFRIPFEGQRTGAFQNDAFRRLMPLVVLSNVTHTSLFNSHERKL